MKRSLRREYLPQRQPRLAALLAFLCLGLLYFLLSGTHSTPYGQRGIYRGKGYGISIGPHFPSRENMLDEMGLDWVKVYDIGQIPLYEDFRVLYRIDVRGYPSDIAAWERGIADTAKQLDSLGVVAVEIGNEPNLGLEWGNNPPNAAQWTDALCRAHRIIKDNAPRLTTVAGGLAPTAGTPDGMNTDDFVFFNEMVRHGAMRCFDAFAYHPYGFNQPPEADPYQHEFSFRRAERMYQLLAQAGIGSRQMWITEFGWVRDPAEENFNCDGHPEFQNFAWMKFPAAVQADYTGRAIRFAQSRWSFVGPIFMWNLDWNLYEDSYENPCSHLRWYGFLSRGGQPLPVYYTIRDVPKIGALPRAGRRDVGVVPVGFPEVGSSTTSLTRSVEAGCVQRVRLGQFKILDKSLSGAPIDVIVEPANGPGRPVVTTSLTQARTGSTVEIFVDTQGMQPGLHLIAVNIRTTGQERVSSDVVRGWLLVQYPNSPECVAGFLGN